MTDADKIMNPQHFGSDLAECRHPDPNPVSNPGSYWMSLDTLVEVCNLRAQSSFNIYYCHNIFCSIH